MRLALIAHATSKVTLFPSVTNPVTRHPVVLAADANSLAEIAPGRVRVMMGSGDLATSSVGLVSATVAQMREAALTVRSLLQGESAMHAGHLVGAFDHTSSDPPALYINASSPRMLACAGEAADGVYAMVGTDPDVMARAREHVGEGAARAGRNPAEPPIAWGVPVYMGDTFDDAVEGMRAYAFSNVSKRNKVFSRVMGELHPEVTQYAKAADMPAATVAMLGQALGVVGTPDECGARLADWVRQAGVDHIICRIYYKGADAMTALDALIDRVLPKIRG